MLSIGWLSEAQGQSATVPPASPTQVAGSRWALSVDLVPVPASGYHFSAERRLGQSSRQTVVFTPQFYRGPVSTLTSDLAQAATDQVRGFGLGAQHRIYLGRQPTPLAGSYLAYGLSYQHFGMRFQGISWQAELAADGLYYYQSRLRDQTETINRYGASVVVGHQATLPDTPLFLDFFLGVGLRHATSRTTLPSPRFATRPADYGSAGLYLPVGFRLGLRL
ncbi:hypothetical protein D0T11_17585 [Hymenobacter rubripertinctus]|uniref:DUF3575 domain-containing protein n=1 Tax=Hymenobacter rubripertinctus TaxID=2029981 RepID=A0A418QP09_9BACT|nr:hypothetical protein D0T11_17585 [Hymenobacter rubripertinctus]